MEPLFITLTVPAAALLLTVILWLYSELSQPPGRRNFWPTGYLHFLGLASYEYLTPEEREVAIIQFVRARVLVSASDIRQHLIDLRAGPYHFIHRELDGMRQLVPVRGTRGRVMYELAPHTPH